MILVDTNVLLYMFDSLDPGKQAQAIHVCDHMRQVGIGCLSAQILGEFCQAGMRNLHLDKSFVLEQVKFLADSWPVIDLSPQIVIEAARGVRDHSLAYYDAQIWATARLNQIPVIFSEDFNSWSSLEGVRFVNPFDEARFRLEDWV